MILRTYACEACNFMIEVELSAEQWDTPPPACPACASRAMQQELAPPHIGGSPRARATALALDIAERDYGVADMQADGQEGATPKVRYRDQTPATQSSWGIASEALQQAVAQGRENRLRYGTGLDVLRQGLRTGAQPDLIELSKQRGIRVW